MTRGKFTMDDYNYYINRGDFLSAHAIGVKSISEITKDFRTIAVRDASKIDELEHKKLREIGFKERDIEFMSHLNLAISLGGSFKYPKLLSGAYSEGGRTLTNKLFNGHLTVTEIITVLYKFK